MKYYFFMLLFLFCSVLGFASAGGDSLDAFLKSHGFSLCPIHSKKNEGYLSDAQKLQMKERLAAYPTIRKMAEIGLNGGHSAENFLMACPYLELFVSFDINQHPYTKYAAQYFSRRYSKIFQFIQGDSNLTVPFYALKNPSQKFDLIYIDGGHTFECAKNDIVNCKKIAHRDTILWIDDCDLGSDDYVNKAVKQSVREGIIRVVNVFPSYDPKYGHRCWLEAQYLFAQ
jgi:predicted O-methyltransferase YrrM